MAGRVEYKPGRFVSLTNQALVAFPAVLLGHTSDAGSHGALFHEFLSENYVMAQFKTEVWKATATLSEDADGIMKVVRARQWFELEEPESLIAIWPGLWECMDIHPVDQLGYFLRYGYLSKPAYDRFLANGCKFERLNQSVAGSQASGDQMPPPAINGNHSPALGVARENGGSPSNMVNRAHEEGPYVGTGSRQGDFGPSSGMNRAQDTLVRRIGNGQVASQLTWMGELPVSSAVDLPTLVNHISKGVQDSSKYDSYVDDDLDAVVQRFRFLVEMQGATERQAAELVPLFLKGRALRAFHDEFRDKHKALGQSYTAKEAWNFVRERFHGKEFRARAKKEFEAARWTWSSESYDDVERTLRKLADKIGIQDEDLLIMRLRSMVPREMVEEMRRFEYPQSVDQQVSIIQTILQQSAFSKYNAVKPSRGDFGSRAGPSGTRPPMVGLDQPGKRSTGPTVNDRFRPGSRRILAMRDQDPEGSESDLEPIGQVDDGAAHELSRATEALDEQANNDLLLFVQERKPGTCWKCGKPGHLYAACPDRQKEGKLTGSSNEHRAGGSGVRGLGERKVVWELAKLNRDIEKRVLMSLQSRSDECLVLSSADPSVIAVDNRFIARICVRVFGAAVEPEHHDLEVLALLDTGSDRTIVRQDRLDGLPLKVQLKPFLGQGPLHGGNQPMQVEGILRLDLVLHNTSYAMEALVVRELPVQMIIGTDFLMKHVESMQLSRGVVQLKGADQVLLSVRAEMNCESEARSDELAKPPQRTQASKPNFVHACESMVIGPNSVGFIRASPKRDMAYADYLIEPMDPFANVQTVRMVAQAGRVYSKSRRPKLMIAVMNYGAGEVRVMKEQRLGVMSQAVAGVELDHASAKGLPSLWSEPRLSSEAKAYLKFWDTCVETSSLGSGVVRGGGHVTPVAETIYLDFGKEREVMEELQGHHQDGNVYVCVPSSYDGPMMEWLGQRSSSSFIIPKSKVRAPLATDANKPVTPFWDLRAFCMSLKHGGSSASTCSVVQEDEQRRGLAGLVNDLTLKASENVRALSWPHLSELQSRQLRDVLLKHAAVFEERLGRVKAYRHNIEVTQTKPVFRPPPRRSQEEARIERDEVAKMLKQGVIRPGRSPWGFPNVLVKKHDGSWRVTTNFRALNAITRKDQYPLPRVDDVLGQLAGQKYFSSLDCRTGYWQIELDDMAKEMCAMVTSDGTYVYQVMPMGMINSTATFQRLMDVILGHLKRKACLAYVDDVTVHGASFEEHLQNLDGVLTRLEEAGMTLKLSKCVFMQEELVHLGHEVSAEGIKPSMALVEKIRGWDSNLESAEEVMRFLGLVLFFSRFIPNFSNRTRHLRAVLKGSGCNAKKRYKGEKLPEDPKWSEKWTKDHVLEVEDLKNALCTEPVMLYHPDLSLPFVVETDASGTQLGAILMQKKDEVLRVVSYHSRVLKDAETRYSVTEQECLAVVDAIQRWRHYLHGVRFTVVTDHAALKWLLGLTDTTGRIARWVLKLNDYDFEVMVRPGKDHVIADALSRARMVTADDAKVNSIALATRSTGRTVEEVGRIAARRDVGIVNMPSAAEVALEQRRDEEWRPVVEALESGDEASAEHQRWLEDFMVREDGVLVRHSKWIRLGVIVVREQVVIPEKYVETVLAAAHMSRVGGHFGVTRTYYKICEMYWWSQMRQDVYRYVINCHTCIANSRLAPKRSERAPLRTYDVSRRFQIVMVDLLGGLPVSVNDNKVVLVMTDAFTKYTACVALPNATAEIVAQAILDEWVMRFGPPESLLSDRGVQFTGRVVEHLCMMLGIKKIFTTAYHPETDGQTERFNSSLLKLLRVYCDGHQSSWDTWLQSCCFVYNTSIHATTRMTPYELMFGSKAPEFFDLAAAWGAQSHENLVGDAVTGAHEWLDKLNESIRVASALAYRYALKSKDDYARYHDAKLIARRVDADGMPVGPQWRVDDLVYVWTPRAAYQGTSKLTPQWVGPYRVTKIVNPVNVIASDVKTGAQIRVHVNRLRRVSEEVITVSNIPLVTQGGVLPNGYHVIDRIVGHRQKPGAPSEFKVRWMDRSMTWEVERNLPETLIWDFRVASGVQREVEQDVAVETEAVAPMPASASGVTRQSRRRN